MTNASSKIIRPGLIVMVDGVFRPAEIADANERIYGSLNMKDWLKLGDEQIDPKTIEMTSAAYLGARRFLEWAGSDIMGHILRNIVHGANEANEKIRALKVNSIMAGIVHQAAELGARTGARYFGVITDTFSPQEALDLTIPPESLFCGRPPFKPKYDEINDLDLGGYGAKERLRTPEKLCAPRRTVETILHPTANFYREK